LTQSAGAPVGTAAAYRRLLANQRLTRFLAGEFISSIGDWLYLVAMLVLVYDETRSALLLAIVGAARTLPAIVLSVPAGILVDRVDRRSILLVTDIVRAGLMFAMAGAVLVGASISVVVGLAVVTSVFLTFNRPALGAYLPSLATDERELGPANSAYSTLDSAAFIVGPAVGGLLVAAGGAAVAFALNGVTFLVAGAVVLTLPRQRARRQRQADDIAETEAPASLTAIFRRIAGPLILDISTSLVFGGVGVLTVIIATDILRSGDAGTGYLNAAFGVGGLCGALIGGALVLRRPDAPLLAGVIACAVGIAGLGLAATVPLALAALAVAVLGAAIIEVISVTLVQRAIPDELRGRALGVIQTASITAFALSSFVVPLAAAAVGLAPVLITGAAFLAVSGIVAVVLVRRQLPPPIDAARAHAISLPLFTGLAPDRLALAAARMTDVNVKAGDIVIQQGDVADRFYVVVEGTFAATQVAGGATTELRQMGPDHVFGEIGLLNSIPRTATVTALTDGRLLALDRDDFLAVVSTADDVRSRLLRFNSGMPALAEHGV
jgi:MFS family permease